jgi:hypothetical protein
MKLRAHKKSISSASLVLQYVGATGQAALLGRFQERILLMTSETELVDDEKVTIFAPVDGAWPPDDVLPVGAAFITVRCPDV